MPEEQRLLIKRALTGDTKAFETLIADYQLYAYNIALKMVGNPEDAKDVAQEALIKVYKHLNSFNHNASFSTWLYRIVINACYDFNRQNKQTVSLVDERDGKSVDVVDHSLSADELLEVDEKRQLIERALKRLPDDNRLCMVLRHIHGMSYDEISGILKVPLGTVKSRLTRGRHMLKAAVESDPAFTRELL